MKIPRLRFRLRDLLAFVAFEACLIELLKRAFPYDYYHGPFLIVTSNRIVVTLSVMGSVFFISGYALVMVHAARARSEKPSA